MFQRILVPVDGSATSMAAVRFGASIASECDADLEVVCVASSETHKVEAQAEIERGIETLTGIVPKVSILVHDSVPGAISERCEADAGAMVVMASTGRGRSAAVLGSVAEEVVGQTFGPLVVIGPNATEPRPLAGNIVVPVDGSKFSESSLTIAGAWGIGFGGTPWVVQVLSPDITRASDYLESSYTTRLAQGLHARTHREVDSEILHGTPARAIADFASDMDARLIVMSTHGRTGLRRVRLGSVAAGVVHRAPCPVVLHRPPNLVW